MDPSEYNKCVNNYADSVYRFIFKNMGDREKARDVVQESFSKMWEKAPEVEYNKAKSYLFSTAYHTMIDMIRKDKRNTVIEDSHMNHQITFNAYSDLQEVLNRALDTLPEIQKVVITLRDYEGYSYEEIGKITGLTESQVKVYIYRGRVALKSYLGSIEKVL
ncbi:MAG TPA: RNA polymerase sigma factor [Lentimicrobium sp.]|nr:RNA polymerase sigma factor [Lentimicrobium sp.]